MNMDLVFSRTTSRSLSHKDALLPLIEITKGATLAWTRTSGPNSDYNVNTCYKMLHNIL